MPLNERAKKLLWNLLRFGLSFALLAYLYHQIDIEKTTHILKSADLTLIIYAFGIFLFINFIILIRWIVFIRALGLHASFLKVARCLLIGLFGNLFLPSAIGGDVIKTLGLCHNSSQKPKAVASVLLDRLSGFAGIVIVATLAFACGFHLINDLSLFLSILIMAVISVAIGTVLFHEKIYSFCCRIFTAFPKIKQGLMNVHYDIVLLKDRKDAIYQGIGVACFGHILLAFMFFLSAKALHQDVALIYFFIFVPLICVAAAVPSIGGLGAREAGAAYLFAKAGMDSGVAVSISLISYLFMVMIGLAGGVIYMATRRSDGVTG